MKVLSKLWPILLLVLVGSLFFYPFFVKGLIPLSSDLIVGTYFPWLDYSYLGFNHTFPVKNPITSDVISFSYPMRMLAVDLIKSGRWPLWNDLILMGTPLLANFQSAPFSITNLVYFIFPRLEAWSLQVILQPILASLFMYLLLRELGRSKVSSIAGGIFFAFSGFMIIWLEWNAHTLVAAFFPLVFYLLLKWLHSKNLFFLLLYSLTLTFQIFAGYPQIILYQFLAIFIFIILYKKESLTYPNGFAQIIFFTLLGIGGAAIQVIPAAELLSVSQRTSEIIPDLWTFLPWEKIVVFFAPDYFGNHATYNYWGPADYTSNSIYSGLIVFILASLGAVSFFREKAVRFALLIILLTLIIVLENPISKILKDTHLLGLQAAGFHRAIILSNLGFAILASFGVDTLVTHKISLRKIMISILPLLSFLIAVLAITFFHLNQLPFLPEDFLNKDPKVINNFNIGLRNLFLPFVFLALSCLLFSAYLRFKNFSKIITVFIITVATLELFRFGWKYIPFSPKETVFPSTPIIDFLQNQEQPFRIVTQEVIPNDLMMEYNLQTAEGYDAVYPARSAQFLAVLNSLHANSLAQGRYGIIRNINSPFLSLTDTRFILFLKKNDLDNDNFNKVFEDGSIVIFENNKSFKRAKMFYAWDILNRNDTLARLINDYPLEQRIILDEDPLIEASPGVSNIGLKNFNDKKEVMLNTDKAGVLFISNAWYPGWVALVNGQETKIIPANYNFMAVPIKSIGQSVVKLEYKPDSFEKGKMISLISLIIIVILTGLKVISQSRNKYEKS